MNPFTKQFDPHKVWGYIQKEDAEGKLLLPVTHEILNMGLACLALSRLAQEYGNYRIGFLLAKESVKIAGIEGSPHACHAYLVSVGGAQRLTEKITEYLHRGGAEKFYIPITDDTMAKVQSGVLPMRIELHWQNIGNETVEKALLALQLSLRLRQIEQLYTVWFQDGKSYRFDPETALPKPKSEKATQTKPQRTVSDGSWHSEMQALLAQEERSYRRRKGVRDTNRW